VNGSNKRMPELQAVFEAQPRVRVFLHTPTLHSSPLRYSSASHSTRKLRATRRMTSRTPLYKMSMMSHRVRPTPYSSECSSIIMFITNTLRFLPSFPLKFICVANAEEMDTTDHAAEDEGNDLQLTPSHTAPRAVSSDSRTVPHASTPKRADSPTKRSCEHTRSGSRRERRLAEERLQPGIRRECRQEFGWEG
jgi:hypothetical protein